jgi:glycosyltransferase involved in cell wall biosynthesis
MLKAGRPPQWWRGWRDWQRELDELDVLLTPSQASARIHRERGLRRAMEVLPYFVGDEWRVKLPSAPTRGRPYFAFAGRLVKEKGLGTLIPTMRRLPGVDLRIAGRGPYEAELRAMASGMENVEFLGHLGFQGLREFYAGARALVAPSRMVETFGYVVLESHAVGTPAIVPDLGGISESVRRSGGGIIYQSDAELFEALGWLAEDDTLRSQLGGSARDAVEKFWTEEQHMEQYFAHLGAAGPARAR